MASYRKEWIWYLYLKSIISIIHQFVVNSYLEEPKLIHVIPYLGYNCHIILITAFFFLI